MNLISCSRHWQFQMATMTMVDRAVLATSVNMRLDTVGSPLGVWLRFLGMIRC